MAPQLDGACFVYSVLALQLDEECFAGTLAGSSDRQCFLRRGISISFLAVRLFFVTFHFLERTTSITVLAGMRLQGVSPRPQRAYVGWLKVHERD